jgi:hypothetical protein
MPAVGQEVAGRDPDTALVRSHVPDSVRKAQQEQARAMQLLDLARQVEPERIENLGSLKTAEKAYVKKMAEVLQPPEPARKGDKEKVAREVKLLKEAKARKEAEAAKDKKSQKAPKDAKSSNDAEGEVEP